MCMCVLPGFNVKCVSHYWSPSKSWKAPALYCRANPVMLKILLFHCQGQSPLSLTWTQGLVQLCLSLRITLFHATPCALCPSHKGIFSIPPSTGCLVRNLPHVRRRSRCTSQPGPAPRPHRAYNAGLNAACSSPPVGLLSTPPSLSTPGPAPRSHIPLS